MADISISGLISPILNAATSSPPSASAPMPVEEVKKTTVKKQRQRPIPKDSEGFFRARAKDPELFQFTANGDLQVPQMRGEPPKVIPLPFYTPATIDQIRELEELQIDELKQAEKEIDETSRLLRDAMIEWRETGASSEVLRYQRELQRLDSQRTQIRYPVRWTKVFENPPINKILLEEFYEKRKIGYRVEALRTRGISFEKMVRASSVKQEVAAEADASGLEKAEASVLEQESFVVFFNAADVEYGLLSPDTFVDFRFNMTQYNSLIQAYEGERVAALGGKDLRPSILKSRNPRQIRMIGSKIVGQVENPRELLINIIKSLVSQHPRFMDAVRKTGTDTLIFADPRDGVLGVGLPAEDPQIIDRKAWKGQNLLGQAWQAVRSADIPGTEGAEGAEGAVEAVDAVPTEFGKTKQDVNAERAKVLMGRYRSRKG
jgi:predicted NAD-dependent protein-ADP-ribosyltransferase YbiA (DUF1768 family)